ncbi:MAG: cupin domain-containing protein [Chloroflexi bacterium]|nr:cupin domain-containing protein [Chloroflexota bacterium]
MWKNKRYVVGPNPGGKSCVLTEQVPNTMHEPGHFNRAELWWTAEMPVDNTITEDRSLCSKTREPVAMGATFRALELLPDDQDIERHKKIVERLHHTVGAKHMPTAEDYAKHPSMHRTDTLDFIVCVRGEIWLVTDTDEVLMQPGDCVIIRGVNHAWSNRSDQPCLLMGAMLDAKPSM